MCVCVILYIIPFGSGLSPQAVLAWEACGVLTHSGGTAWHGDCPPCCRAARAGFHLTPACSSKQMGVQVGLGTEHVPVAPAIHLSCPESSRHGLSARCCAWDAAGVFNTMKIYEKRAVEVEIVSFGLCEVLFFPDKYEVSLEQVWFVLLSNGKHEATCPALLADEGAGWDTPLSVTNLSALG